MPREKGLSQTLLVPPSEFIDGHQVPSQPSLVKAEQGQVPQALIVGSALLAPDQEGGPPLDPLNVAHIPPEVGRTELDTVL